MTIGRDTLGQIRRRVSPRHTLLGLAPYVRRLEAREIRPSAMPRLEARVIRPVRPEPAQAPRTLTPPPFPVPVPVAPSPKLYALRMTGFGFAIGAVLVLLAYLGTNASVLSSL
jgi:hypothetical protein